MPYAVIDTETTGFSGQDRVIEVGVVLLGDGLEPEGDWDTLIDPARDLGPVHVHHITPADVAGAPTFAEAAGPLVGHLAGRVLVGHNIGFDSRMLNQEFERLGVGRPLLPAFTLDTITLARRLHLSPSHVYTLDRLCDTLGITRAVAHAALADAQATAQLFTLAAARLAQPTGRPEPAPVTPADRWAAHHAAARSLITSAVGKGKSSYRRQGDNRQYNTFHVFLLRKKIFIKA
jgi:DNA polymerase-3 subunit epsilon